MRCEYELVKCTLCINVYLFSCECVCVCVRRVLCSTHSERKSAPQTHTHAVGCCGSPHLDTTYVFFLLLVLLLRSGRGGVQHSRFIMVPLYCNNVANNIIEQACARARATQRHNSTKNLTLGISFDAVCRVAHIKDIRAAQENIVRVFDRSYIHNVCGVCVCV